MARLWNDGTLRFRLDSQRARELGIWFTGASCEVIAEPGFSSNAND